MLCACALFELRAPNGRKYRNGCVNFLKTSNCEGGNLMVPSTAVRSSRVSLVRRRSRKRKRLNYVFIHLVCNSLNNLSEPKSVCSVQTANSIWLSIWACVLLKLVGVYSCQSSNDSRKHARKRTCWRQPHTDSFRQKGCIALLEILPDQKSTATFKFFVEKNVDSKQAFIVVDTRKFKSSAETSSFFIACLFKRRLLKELPICARRCFSIVKQR